MSAIEALKSACKPAAMFRNFKDIEIGVYDVKEFKFTVTKFGKKLVVRTEDFMCFLPDRCSKAITTEKQLVELNEGAWVMKYDGRDPKRGNCILVNIVEKQQQQSEQPGQEWEWKQYLTLGDQMQQHELFDRTQQIELFETE